MFYLAIHGPSSGLLRGALFLAKRFNHKAFSMNFFSLNLNSADNSINLITNERNNANFQRQLVSSVSNFYTVKNNKKNEIFYNSSRHFSPTFKSMTDSTTLKHAQIFNSSDIASRIVQKLPIQIQPYARLMRLDKLTGVWLLLLPCWWSLALSTTPGNIVSLFYLSLFGLGAVTMRSCGCIINDIWDRKYDRHVERTKNRPLASKEISLLDSLILVQGLLSVGLLITCQFDVRSIILGASSLSLAAVYPSFKRFTYWPQFILGLTFNWGALLGWSVNCQGELDLLAVLPLYAAGVCWTLVYDTIYAHQDKKFDFSLGLKSTALKFGDRTRQYLHGFTALMAANLIGVGLYTEQTWPYYLSLLASFSTLSFINHHIDFNSNEQCSRAFRQNTNIGWCIFLGIVFSTWLKTKSDSHSDDDDGSENDHFKTLEQND